MSRFKIGDRVRVTTSQKTGTVRAIYDSDYWNLWNDSEYGIEFDDGSGTINLVERVLRFIGETDDREKKCHCGVASVGTSKHSDYCPLYETD